MSRAGRRLRRRVRRFCRHHRRPLAVTAAAAVVLAAAAHSGTAHHPPRQAPADLAAAPAGPAGAARAIAWASAQLGAPYVWAGTGPYSAGFDCSGLVMRAWQAAGVTLPRTSQDQWAHGDRVSSPQPGDLAFFAGSDGTRAEPGHVGLVTDPARHLMIDAYAAGFPVRFDTYGLPGSAAGLSDPVGFTDPAAGR